MISEICAAFTCLPDEAERQSPQLVQRIMLYRNAKLAVEWFNEGQTGAEKLAKHPALLTLLREIDAAQGLTDSDDAFSED